MAATVYERDSPTTGFSAKWRLRNKGRNSILMTCLYPGLNSSSYWSSHAGNVLQPIRSTTPHVISLKLLRLSLGRNFAGKPAVASERGCRHYKFSILFALLLQIITCLVDPLLQMCSMSASHLNASDMAAYMINCIHQIQSTLAVYEFTDKHIEMLAGQVGNSNHRVRCLD